MHRDWNPQRRRITLSYHPVKKSAGLTPADPCPTNGQAANTSQFWADFDGNTENRRDLASHAEAAVYDVAVPPDAPICGSSSRWTLSHTRPSCKQGPQVLFGFRAILNRGHGRPPLLPIIRIITCPTGGKNQRGNRKSQHRPRSNRRPGRSLARHIAIKTPANSLCRRLINNTLGDLAPSRSEPPPRMRFFPVATTTICRPRICFWQGLFALFASAR